MRTPIALLYIICLCSLLSGLGVDGNDADPLESAFESMHRSTAERFTDSITSFLQQRRSPFDAVLQDAARINNLIKSHSEKENESNSEILHAEIVDKVLSNATLRESPTASATPTNSADGSSASSTEHAGTKGVSGESTKKVTVKGFLHISESGKVIGDLSTNSLTLRAKEGFGTESGFLWYHEKSDSSSFVPNTIYTMNGNLATQSGSLITSDSVILMGRNDYGGGTTRLFFMGNKQEPLGQWRQNSLYLSFGSFRTVSGSIEASDYLMVRCRYGQKAGDSSAQLWFNGTPPGNLANNMRQNTLHLESGDFKTQNGSLVSSRSVEMEPMGLPEGTSSKVQNAKLSFDGPTQLVTMENSSLRVSGGGISTSSYFEFSANPGMGDGTTRLFYSVNNKNYPSSALVLETASFAVGKSLYVTNDALMGGNVIISGHLHVGHTKKINVVAELEEQRAVSQAFEQRVKQLESMLSELLSKQ